MDFSLEESMRFAAAIATATDVEDLPQWVKDAADAADREVGVHAWSLRHPDRPAEMPSQRVGSPNNDAHQDRPQRHEADATEPGKN
jgi:hypothetical protein